MFVSLVLSIVYLTTIYFLPGLVISRFLKGHLRNNPFNILFLSVLVLPFFYLFLASINRLTALNWTLLLLGCLYIAHLISAKFRKELIDTDVVFPVEKTKFNRILKGGFYTVLVSFVILIMIAKVGLPFGFTPVGDDKPQSQKNTAIAISPQLPIFYNFPISPLTIYYFNNIGSGLTTKFTNNFITVNQSWFMHTFIFTTVMVYLIYLLATRLFTTYLERFILALLLTYGSGLEYFVAQIKGFRGNHLEWWTDWIGLTPQIHTQISAFYTLYYWVPQHLFGALLIIPLYFLIVSPQRQKLLTKILIALILAAIIGYTAFVFITVALIYTLYFLIRLVQRKESLVPVLKENLVIGGIAFLLALPMLALYAGAEKASWFSIHTNVFWFLPNSLLQNKPINLVLTALVFFIIEFGPLFIIFLYGFWLFIKEKKYQDTFLYWGLFLYVPIWVIFFIKAMDDNNISMRALIPTQIALAVFAAWVVGYWWRKWKDKTWRFRTMVGIISILLITNLPTTLYETSQRTTEQFNRPDPIFAQIDNHIPLNSIIFTSSKVNADVISTLAHRFTFKPARGFNVTDFEYVATAKLYPYSSWGDDTYGGWLKILADKKQLSQNYHLFLLMDRGDFRLPPNSILFNDKFILKPFPQ